MVKVSIVITEEQINILKIQLAEQISAYKIARKLNRAPSSVYRSIGLAKENLHKVEKVLFELKQLGYPDGLEIKKKRAEKRRKTSEIDAFKFG